MTAIDTSNWIHNDNLSSISNSALDTFANNQIHSYTLLESSPGAYTTQGVAENHFGLRYDLAQVPSLRSNVPTFGQTSFVTRTSLAHGKSVRPYQHLTWTASTGQHIHCIPTLDNIQIELGQQLTGENRWFVGDGARPPIVKLNFWFWYGSVTNNYAFPNFNAASPEFDIWIFNQANRNDYIKILNFPVSTTGAGSNIVFSTTAPSGNMLRRETYGVLEQQVHSITHIPSASQYEVVGDVNNVFGFRNIVDGHQNLINKYVVAVRMHSQTAPYVRSHNVSRQTNPVNILSQAGVYAAPEDHTHTGDSYSSTGRYSYRIEHEEMQEDNRVIDSPIYAGVGNYSASYQSTNPAAREIRSEYKSVGLYTADLLREAGSLATPAYSDEIHYGYTIAHGSQSIEIGGDDAFIPVVGDQ